MTSKRARTDLAEHLLLEHVSEGDLLGVLKYLKIDPIARERAALHLERCTICHRRLEARLLQIKDGTLPSHGWEERDSKSFRFPAPLRVLVNKRGELIQESGPPALTPAFVHSPLNRANEPSEKDESALPKLHTGRGRTQRWKLHDEERGVTLELELKGIRGEKNVVVEFKLRLEAVGAAAADARFEIHRVTEAGNELVASDRLFDIAARAVAVPPGRFVARVSTGKPALVWEIPFEAAREA
jgi:hypothetical protein